MQRLVVGNDLRSDERAAAGEESRSALRRRNVGKRDSSGGGDKLALAGSWRTCNRQRIRTNYSAWLLKRNGDLKRIDDRARRKVQARKHHDVDNALVSKSRSVRTHYSALHDNGFELTWVLLKSGRGVPSATVPIASAYKLAS